MKHLFALFLLSLVAQMGLSQQLDSIWEPTVAYSFGNNVRIRKSPDLNAPVVGKLQMGESVQVTHKTSDLIPLAGANFPFVRVITAQGVEGFVWSGLMAHHVEEGSFPGEDTDGLLMLGLVVTGDSSHWALRQVREGKLLAEIPISGEGIEDHSWCSYDNRSTEISFDTPEGFDPPLTLVMVTEGICGCGCYSHTVIHTWDGKSMQLVVTANDEDDVGYASSTFSSWDISYPDRLGSPNRLAIIQTSGRHEENEDFTEPAEETTEMTMYEWDGHRLSVVEE